MTTGLPDTPILIALVSLAAAIIGWFARVTLAALNRPVPKDWNGNERRMKAVIDDHTVHCPNIERLERAMNAGFGKLEAELRELRGSLEAHRDSAHR